MHGLPRSRAPCRERRIQGCERDGRWHHGLEKGGSTHRDCEQSKRIALLSSRANDDGQSLMRGLAGASCASPPTLQTCLGAGGSRVLAASLKGGDWGIL